MLILLAQTAAQVVPAQPPISISAIIQSPPENWWSITKDVLSVVVPLVAGLLGAWWGGLQAQKTLDRQLEATEKERREMRKHEDAVRRKSLFADYAIAAQRFVGQFVFSAIKDDARDQLVTKMNGGKAGPNDHATLDRLREQAWIDLADRVQLKNDLEVARLKLVTFTDQDTYSHVNRLHGKVISMKSPSSPNHQLDLTALQAIATALTSEIDNWVAEKSFEADTVIASGTG